MTFKCFVCRKSLNLGVYWIFCPVQFCRRSDLWRHFLKLPRHLTIQGVLEKCQQTPFPSRPSVAIFRSATLALWRHFVSFPRHLKTPPNVYRAVVRARDDSPSVFLFLFFELTRPALVSVTDAGPRDAKPSTSSQCWKRQLHQNKPSRHGIDKLFLPEPCRQPNYQTNTNYQ